MSQKASKYLAQLLTPFSQCRVKCTTCGILSYTGRKHLKDKPGHRFEVEDEISNSSSDEDEDEDEKKSIGQVITEMNIIMRMFLAGFIDRSEYEALKNIVTAEALDKVIKVMKECIDEDNKDEWEESGRTILEEILAK
jgi:hypothetical protein